MKKSKFLIIFSLLITTPLFADYSLYTLDSYEAVNEMVEEEVALLDSDNLLVVFDLDRTLLLTEECIEKGKMSGFYFFEQKVKKCNANITSPLAVELIYSLQVRDQYVMALTARRDTIIDATLEQLSSRLNFQVPIHFQTAPGYSEFESEITFTHKNKEKSLVYKKGVAFASGANKGSALSGILDAHPQFTHVVFLDDDKDNIRDLKKAFEDHPAFVTIIHYTEFEDY